MIRSFWLSARTQAAPKVKATTNEAIKKCFIETPCGCDSCAMTAFFVDRCQNSPHLTEFWDRLRADTPGTCQTWVNSLDLFVLCQLQLRLQQMQLLLPILPRVCQGDLVGIERRQHRMR